MPKADKSLSLEEPHFLSACSMTGAELQKLSSGTSEERYQGSIPLSQVSKEDVLKVQPISFWSHLSCVLFLGLGVPNGVFTIPLLTFLLGKLVVGNVARTFQGLGILLLPLIILPQPFVASTLHSWMAVQILKYFSFRFIMEERPPSMSPDEPKHRPRILVAPPHGVFPYGNLLAALLWPSLTGHHFQGLASSAALRAPIFKQILRSIGVIDASRSSARKALENYPYTIGISTGGVAEVFETNADDECVIMKERIGMIKLAIRTGADLCPCYLFGNTKLLSCWAGEGIPGARTILESISRKAGFALILIFGRFGLPIPFRVPVMGVCGKPIPTHHMQSEEPTNEQVQEVQKKLINDMQELFDNYKGLYGWEDKTLIIK